MAQTPPVKALRRRAPTGPDQSNADRRRGVFKERPPLLSAKLWSDPVGARQLRAECSVAARPRATPWADFAVIGVQLC